MLDRSWNKNHGPADKIRSNGGLLPPEKTD
jgi:hypothetical protein